MVDLPNQCVNSPALTAKVVQDSGVQSSEPLVSYVDVLKRGLGESTGRLRVLRNRDQKNGHQLSYQRRLDEEIIITKEEVQKACLYWDSSLIGYVLGEKVLFSAMAVFVKNRWKGICDPEIFLHDQVSLLSNLLQRRIGLE
ncbi:hypothetical protein Drorol1_Dr00011206 [Drosera rotundifolia]